MNKENEKALLTEREKCAQELESFAREYVAKWIGAQGESVKSEAWAILQAADHIRANAKVRGAADA